MLLFVVVVVVLEIVKNYIPTKPTTTSIASLASKYLVPIYGHVTDQ